MRLQVLGERSHGTVGARQPVQEHHCLARLLGEALGGRQEQERGEAQKEGRDAAHRDHRARSYRMLRDGTVSGAGT